MTYCTNTEVLDRMGYDDATDSNLIQRIDDAIAAATIAINNDTGRYFEPVTATKEFGQTGCQLRVPDLISVTTLKLDDNDDATFETTIADTGYELDTVHTDSGWPFEIVRLLDRNFPTGGRRRRRIEIAGSWGWAAVPTPINQACSLLAARLSQRANTALFGIQSFGELGTQGIKTTDPDYEMMIAPYRQPGIA